MVDQRGASAALATRSSLSARTIVQGNHTASNIYSTQGDAQELPYADNTFDSAYLVATLGEVSDKEATLKELHRVLKPEGRLVVGEGPADPHMIGRKALQELAEGAGFSFEKRIGGPLGYFCGFKLR